MMHFHLHWAHSFRSLLPWPMQLGMALYQWAAEVDALGKIATSAFNFEIEFFIHADPCLENSCAICTISDCKVRKQAFVKKLHWDMQNVLPDAKHSLLETGLKKG